jgi:poly(A) polymerase
VSTFRREPTEAERRGRPGDDGVVIWRDNEYGTIEQDARRRDFTVNALYYDPLNGQEVVDYCGGLPDLKAGVVRAIGAAEVRLAEDPVRILRALKLAGQYQFRLEPELAAAVTANAGQIHKASRARLYEELLKIFAKPYTAPTFSAFLEYGLLQHYLPEFASAWNAAPGQLTRQLLAERDRRLAAGDYSRSRTLALATAAAPTVSHELGISFCDEDWLKKPGAGSAVREVVRKFFDPLPIPRFLSARVRELLLLLPRFASFAHKNRALHHPEYRYARELYSLLTECCGWPLETIEQWPTLGTVRRRRRPPGRKRQKHVRRSHHKQWEDK